MEEKKLVICDSDVIIEFLDRDNKSIINQLVDFGKDTICVSSVTYSEVIFGAKNKDHQKSLITSFESLIVVDIIPSIDSIHRELIRKYSLSHKLSIQDSLIAATAIDYGMKLYTLNKKDFRFIEGLELIK